MIWTPKPICRHLLENTVTITLKGQFPPLTLIFSFFPPPGGRGERFVFSSLSLFILLIIFTWDYTYMDKTNLFGVFRHTLVFENRVVFLSVLCLLYLLLYEPLTAVYKSGANGETFLELLGAYLAPPPLADVGANPRRLFRHPRGRIIGSRRQ